MRFQSYAAIIKSASFHHHNSKGNWKGPSKVTFVEQCCTNIELQITGEFIEVTTILNTNKHYANPFIRRIHEQEGTVIIRSWLQSQYDKI